MCLISQVSKYNVTIQKKHSQNLEKLEKIAYLHSRSFYLKPKTPFEHEQIFDSPSDSAWLASL